MKLKDVAQHMINAFECDPETEITVVIDKYTNCYVLPETETGVMRKWDYWLAHHPFDVQWDHGVVDAETMEEAIDKAKKEMSFNAHDQHGLSNIDFDWLKVEEAKEPDMEVDLR